MIISCIVAKAKNNVIGKDNEIPWYLPADLKYFKKTTINHPVIMGRNCYVSIGNPLPNRTNIIITRDPFFISSNCVIVHSIKEALVNANNTGAEEVFIIGGGQIYELTQSLWHKLYVTEVDIEPEGDVFFPEVKIEDWSLVSEEQHLADDKNEYNYTFKLYERVD